MEDENGTRMDDEGEGTGRRKDKRDLKIKGTGIKKGRL